MNREKVVLVVDDSVSIRREIKMLLEKGGIKVRDVGGEIGFFNSIEEYGIIADLVIMDITLNGEDGLDLISKMRNRDRYKNIPVLVLTQHADRGHVLTARDLGVKAYMKKPIEPKELVVKVKDLLSGNE